jgi:putative transposase
MPRIARAVVAGVPHHVTQRGNGRRAIFDTDADRLLYLDLLRENAVECDLAIWAWCLMSNHVHLVAVPGRSDSLARTLGRTHAAYARYLNVKRRSCGHLFQARFYSCLIGPQHLWMTVAYVERNPQRAGLAVVPWDYPWSSARVHAENDADDRLVDLRRWRLEYTPERWRTVLLSTVDEESDLERLRRATLTGRPLCEPQMLSEWEQVLERPLGTKPGGRPKRRITAVAAVDRLETW